VGVFQTELAPRIVFILGIINLVSGLFVFFTCRCLPGWKIGEKLMQKPCYQKIFKWHCFVWWVFWISVIVHAVFAIGFYSIPF